MTAKRLLLFFLIIILAGCSSSTVKLENWKVRVIKSGYGSCDLEGPFSTIVQEVLIELSVKNIGRFSNHPSYIELDLIDSSGSIHTGIYYSGNLYECEKALAKRFNTGANLDIGFYSEILPGEEEIMLFKFMTDISNLDNQTFKLRFQEKADNFPYNVVAEKIIELPTIQSITTP